MNGPSYIQSVTSLSVRVSQKYRHIPFKNQRFFKKSNYQRNRRRLAIPLVVEFLKNIDFQRRCDTFSETPVQISL